MGSLNKYDQPNCRSIVESADVLHLKPGDSARPSFTNEGAFKDKDVWILALSIRTGLQKSSNTLRVFYDEAELLSAAKFYSIGKELYEDDLASVLTKDELSMVFDQVISGNGSALFPTFDDDGYLSFDIKQKANLLDGCELSNRIYEYFSHEEIANLKELYSDNWEIIANLKYCWCNLPHTSLSFLISLYDYYYYVLRDDFSAGYLLKDIEQLSMGVEAEAAKSLAMREKAGQEGSKKSRQLRGKRIASLMDNVEAIVARNPDIARLGIGPVSQLAVQAAKIADPKLWGQGKGQIDEYLGEIRRGEAGPELKKRYLKIFPPA